MRMSSLAAAAFRMSNRSQGTKLIVLALLCGIAGADPATANNDLSPAHVTAEVPRIPVPELLEKSQELMQIHPRQALDYIREAQKRLSRAGIDQEGELHLRSQWLAGEALSRLGKPHEAESILVTALAKADEHHKNSLLLAGIRQSLSVILAGSDRTGEALYQLKLAQDIYAEHGATRDQVIVLVRLADIYANARAYERALGYYETALSVGHDDPQLEMVIHNNISFVYRDLNRHRASIEALLNALTLAEKLQSNMSKTLIATNLAGAYMQSGELDTAEEWARRSFELIEQEDIKGVANHNWGLLAQVAYRRGNLREAIKLFDRAFNDFDEEGLKATDNAYRELHKAAYEAYREAGNLDKAMLHNAAYTRLEVGMMEAAANTNAALLSAQFDAQNAELRIERLETEKALSETKLRESESRVKFIISTTLVLALFVIMVVFYIRHSASRKTHAEIRKANERLAQANEKLEHSASHDMLTGLPNRAKTRDILTSALKNRRGYQTVGLFLLDLDEFKEVNDTYGHHAGDELLKEASARVQDIIGDRGTLGRLGGDEFAIVFPVIPDRDTSTSLAEAIVSALLDPFPLSSGVVNIGVSVGIALSPGDAESAEALSQSADLALYAAKDAGRGCYRYFERAMRAETEERRLILNDLKAAIEHDGLTLAYQPIIKSSDRLLVGYEALLRWNHPERGPVRPDIFIPIAEEAGLISTIGSWVLFTACNEAARWQSNARIAVNVSAQQIDDSFVDLVQEAISVSGISPDRLELEVTENVFLRPGERTTRRLELLRGLGVRLVLDDFGTGYSSLGYLQRAEFSKIKIDQSFVRRADAGNTEGLAVLQAITHLANTLGMETVAEGVETPQQLDLIRALGCTHLQGYLVGRPEPMAAETRLKAA